jgi:hypothetical protein
MDADVNPLHRGVSPLEDLKLMKQDSGQPTPRAEPSRPGTEPAQYLSTRGLLIVFGGLAVALVLGYLLLSKLLDMSQEEDCALAHRYNCGAVEVPR